jgi:hypothetical protein
MKTRQGFTKKKKDRGLHGGTRSFWLRIQLSSVKLRALRGEFLKFPPNPLWSQIPMRLSCPGAKLYCTAKGRMDAGLRPKGGGRMPLFPLLSATDGRQGGRRQQFSGFCKAKPEAQKWQGCHF